MKDSIQPHINVSSDNKTKKYLLPVGNNIMVETTYVDYANKHIICFSSMIGCPIGCRFCVSGYAKTQRVLTAAEMVEQCKIVIEREHLLDNKPWLFSCMGEGEPFLNYDNVLQALQGLAHLYPNSKLALSTSGIKPNLIKKLAKEQFPVPFKLQVSVHSSSDEIRRTIMPVSRPLAELKSALDEFKLSHKELELNYVLIENVNDSNEDARGLASFAGDILVKLNMLNPVPQSNFHFTSRFDQFVTILNEQGTTWEFYETNGTDIEAACGQLTFKRYQSG